MSIPEINNRLLDTLIFSGVKVDPTLSNKLHLEGMPGLKAIEAINASYKGRLISEGQFFSNVEAEFATLSDPRTASELRHRVASKLNSLAEMRIFHKENNYSKERKFFHKMGQMIQGRGFRTKGEWGQALASKMIEDDMRIYKHQILMGRMPNMERINALSKGQFKEILNDSIFYVKEEPASGGKNKLHFYKALEPEKKEIFRQELCLRDDWYEKAFDIIEGADFNDLREFVESDFALQFQPLKHEFIEMKEEIRNKNIWSQAFYQAISEVTLQEYIKRGDSFSEILFFADQAKIDLQEIIKHPIKLTLSEIDLISRLKKTG